MRAELAIVGGGPAGLAAAIGAARRGLRVVVLERRDWPQDKACGEGLMPSGLRALEFRPWRVAIRTQDIIDGDYHIHWLEQYLAGQTGETKK